MRPTNKSRILSQKKYTQLLIVLVINFVLAPFLDSIIGGLFSSAIFLCATIIIVRTFSLYQKLFRLYLGIAGLAFVLETVGYTIIWNEDIDVSEYELWQNGVTYFC